RHSPCVSARRRFIRPDVVFIIFVFVVVIVVCPGQGLVRQGEGQDVGQVVRPGGFVPGLIHFDKSFALVRRDLYRPQVQAIIGVVVGRVEAAASAQQARLGAAQIGRAHV